MKIIVALSSFLVSILISSALLAQEMVVETIEVVKPAVMSDLSIIGIALSSGLAIAIASLGGALGQGKVAKAAMEGIARNPEAAGKVMTPMIIALALIESLVIYALVIAFLLQGKI